MTGRFMLDVHTAYDQKAKSAVLVPGAGQQLQLYASHLVNRSGGLADMAVAIKLGDSGYKFGLVDGGLPVVDVTTALQAGTAQNIFTTVNNDGFLVQSDRKFGIIGVTLTQAQTVAPVYSFQYFNGVSYVAIPSIIETPDYSTVGDKLIVFPAPRDWAPGSTAGVGGDNSKYSILVLATTAGGQAVIANNVWVGKILHFQPQVPNNGILSLVYSDRFPRLLDSLEGLLPYFSVASAANCVTAKYFSIS